MTNTCFRRGDVRLTRDRHVRDCNLSGCPGCQPCPERHCQVCEQAPPRRDGNDRPAEHVTVDGRGSDQTCAACIAQTREHLADIWSKSARLLGEAIMRGINTQAATLAGPTASPETWGYRRMSVLAGRVDPEWLTAQGKALADDDEPHPLWVLGTWEHQVRLHFNQLRDPDSRSTLTDARDYLAVHLTRIAHDEEFDFAGLAKDLHRCHTHLESVLTEGDRPDTGAPCPVCGRADLVKDYGASTIVGWECRRCHQEVEAGDSHDHCPGSWCWSPVAPEPKYLADDVMWHCPKCDNWWTDENYRSKILGVYEGVAPALTASQIHRQYRVPEATVRSWANRGKISACGRDASGRKLFGRDQIETLRDEWELEKTRRTAVKGEAAETAC